MNSSRRSYLLSAALAGVLLFGNVPSAKSEELGNEEQVQQRFATAVELFKGGDFERALPFFEEVASASDSPNAHYYVGLCSLELNRNVDAYKAFALAARKAEADQAKYGKTREAAIERLSTVAVRVAILVLTLGSRPRGLKVTIDGEPVSELDLGSPVVLDPGVHRVMARAERVVPVVRELEILGGEMTTVTLVFRHERDEAAASAPMASPTRPSAPANEVHPEGASLTTYGWIATAVGATGLGVFAVTGLMTMSAWEDLNEDCPGGCREDRHSDIQRGKTLQAMANVSLVVGAVSVVTGGALLLWSSTDSQQDSGASVALLPGEGKLTVWGAF